MQEFVELRFAKRPGVGPLSPDTYEVRATAMRPLADGECLARVIYLSVDAGSRAMIDDQSDYVMKLQVGDAAQGTGAICEVLESRHSGYAPGDFVYLPFSKWRSHIVFAPDKMQGVTKVGPAVAPLHAYLGLFGMTGLTAYVGMFELFAIRPGETAVISAAAGAVGSVAGQYAKIIGARTIGIAGGPDKCAFVKDELGFDDCLDYRQDLSRQLTAACPDGIDFYYENVGGAVQRIVFDHMRDFGRVAMCGQIAQYSGEGAAPGPNLMSVVLKRLQLRGFLAFDHFDVLPTFLECTTAWYREGRIRDHVSITSGLENAYEAVNMLVSGRNLGKQLIQVSADPSRA